MGRRNLSMMRLGRCIAFLAAAAFLLPFTILLMVADQQYNLTYNSKRVFYQESDFYKINGTYYAPAFTITTPTLLKQYMYENGTNDDGLLSRERFIEVNQRMEARKEYLRSQCSKLGLDDSSHKAYAWEYLINRQYHVIWCNIFKAASTSWMYNFNLMANYTAAFLDKTKDVPLELARKKYARPTVEMIKKAQLDSISFLIVRHPLERLASAYNDKIVHAWPMSFHDKMGSRIVKKYRKQVNGRPSPPDPKYPLFEEFVKYVLDEAKSKKPLDMHWTPYNEFCTPCKFNFDVILKFETLDEDQRYLIQLAHLQDVVKPEWKNSGKGKDTMHNINHLYARLSGPQLDGLFDLYRYDFTLFNYTMDSYYELLTSGETE
ncbi:carbohydrate sulfotransferase 11 isoform X1 [Hyposmocoma kahamanoa]|uniref:carbohydrate sulfotransferase 11 isoform X1 n=2 Tax=Hyposmocoma kahamanoa TaxID=1477025 RepID=UPI000E6D9134|nr:carbohydrate sulfotransferase 11 isoform X1 [Hyposmocoma kahamanoa]